jgi:murein DD-endopeptidase MepM/ murein hydrolase activator NlpD
MSRLWTFLLGLLVGGAGVAFLYHSGTLPLGATRTPVVVDARPAQGEMPKDDPSLIDAVAWPPPAQGKPGGAAVIAPPAPGADGLGTAGTVALASVASVAQAMPASMAGAEGTVPAGEPGGVSAALPPPPSQALLLPVAGVQAGQLTDTYTQSRGTSRVHEAIDIMAARGTPVYAVEDGRVVKLFLSQPGGITLYQFDPSERLAYYYAHLDGYAPGIVEGKQVKRGELIGYVGSTGNASPDAPHLHFAIFALGPEKKWWQGTAINPYPLLSGKPAQ